MVYKIKKELLYYLKIPIKPIYLWFWEKWEEKKLLMLYSNFIKKGDLVFDIGANRGRYTKVFRRLGARVISIEPHPFFIRKLKKKFGKDKNVTIINKGVSGEKKTINFYEAKRKDSSSFDKKYIEKNDLEVERSSEVETIPLQELIEKYGAPSFIKIDVEGFEYEVLKTLDPTRIKALSFENFADKINFDKIMGLLKKDKDLEFNISSGSLNAGLQNLFLKKWLNLEDFKEFFKFCFLIKNFNGDVYVRRKNEAPEI